jgi:hypothetical protein
LVINSQYINNIYLIDSNILSGYQPQYMEIYMNNNEKKSIKNKLKELKQAINHLKKQHITNRPLSERAIVFNWAEAAEVLGVSRMTMWRYRQGFPPPPMPAFRSTLRRWAEKYGLPRKRGPLPKGNQK